MGKIIIESSAYYDDVSVSLMGYDQLDLCFIDNDGSCLIVTIPRNLIKKLERELILCQK